jgi:hypothetical protein
MTNQSDVLYHYCPMDSLYAILESMTLRLTSIRYMNDSKEISWLFELAKNTISKVMHSQQSVEEKKLCKMLSEHGDYLYLDEAFFPNIFCACFSKNDDSLGQWRAYADDGRGVAIGFSRQFLSSFVTTYRNQLKDVEYLGGSDFSLLKDELSQAFQSLKALPKPVLDDHISMVARETQNNWDARAAFSKNAAFKEEAEVRLVHIGSLARTDETNVSATQFACRNQLIIPYKAIKLSEAEQPIVEIVLGPRNSIEHNRRGIYNFAHSKGIRLGIDQITESSASYGELRRTRQQVRYNHLPHWQ